MRLLSNSIDEISAALVIDYEAKPGGDMNANLDRELTAIYKPANTAALAQLHDSFATGETAYFLTRQFGEQPGRSLLQLQRPWPSLPARQHDRVGSRRLRYRAG